MLYETIGIVRPGNIAEVKELVLTAGKLILNQGGVIRDIKNWGTFLLPRPVSTNQQRHTRGHYFVMRYDSSIATHEEVRRTMKADPRVIRTANVKLGDGKLETLSRFGAIPWRSLEEA
ncbi:ribosomal protein S6 [Copromyces sp. CBS 386.78]|uniref:Small ribosomal subunit protein bS6m n=1 Tax=Pseudoneurospora amorphoporcata TaxID=241081 RepID=A0AAN6NS76_9PEZI|nr:ribosomal protein S6 [Copromyces sp. CBS 386.78]KAK3950051.1 ribosomal protein S6 [Pseudoneurospora amorphoporcata]